MRRKDSKYKNNSLQSIEDIHKKYFPYTEKSRFEKCWPEFCKLMGASDTYNYLEYPVPYMEKYFTFSDLYYENLETFLTKNDGDIRNLTIGELFEKYYHRKS